jgi:MFS family permease
MLSHHFEACMTDRNTAYLSISTQTACLFALGINVGIVLGFCMGLFLSGLNDAIEWRFMFLLGTILPCVMIYVATKVMPETPRWYCLKDRYDEARKVLYDIYPPGFNVDLVIEDIKESLERERLAEKTLGWSVIFHPTPAFRRMLVVGIGILVAQQAVGIDAIQYYLLDVLSSTIDSKQGQNLVLILLGLIKLGCIFVAGKLFDTRGRRFFVYLSLIGTSNYLTALQCISEPLLPC